MYKIRCDKSMEELTKKYIEATGINGGISNAKYYDCCILFHADLNLINNIASGSIIIANADDFSLLRTLEGVDNTIITCGLSNVSTITVSSIEEEVCVLCVQREIQALDKNIIIPQEIPVHIIGIKPDVNQLMLLLALGLICSADNEKIKKIKLC